MASKLRKGLTRLGVTFIKLGQFLSLRTDLLPPELAAELSLLQDRVPAFAGHEAKAIVEKELGAPVGTLFQYFENQPLASASIGQVHKAVLKDGRAVAIKIQRANLRHGIDQDLSLMRSVIALLKALRFKGDWQNWLVIVDDFGEGLWREMDYLQEGRNADRLRKILREFPAVVVPRVFWRYTTKCIITEELCEGVKIDQAAALQDLDLKRLCRNIVEAYLEQIVVHGYFHADPHAGNLAVGAQGQLIIYDFGMMGYLTNSQRQGMIDLVINVADSKIPGFINALGQMGLVRPLSKIDREKLESVILPIWMQCRFSPSRDIDLSGLETEMLALSQYFQLPANIVCLIRMIVAVEAIVHRLSPDFNFVRICAPYFKRMVYI